MPAADQSSPAPQNRLAGEVGSGGLVALAMMVMNVLVYGFTLLSTRLLSPGEYGGLGALLGLMITAGVAALALQATAARHLANASGDERSARARAEIRTGTRLAAAVMVTLLAAAPVITHVLHVTWAAALFVAIAMAPLTLLGTFTGILQGLASWRWLAGVFLAFGLGRLVLGGSVLFAGRSVTAATAGLALAACLPALVGWWGTRQALGWLSGAHAADPSWAELWRNAHLLLGFFALTNLDVLIARARFDDHVSGLYAAGAILAKACLFLPQFVIIVAFPQMARDASREDSGRVWLQPLGLVAAIGGAVVVGTFLLRDLAVAFVGGAGYQGLAAFVWWFALEGTLFALLQMAVYHQIAQQATRAVWWLWAAVVVVLGAALISGEALTPRRLLGLVVLVTVGCLVALIARRRPGSRTVAQ